MNIMVILIRHALNSVMHNHHFYIAGIGASAGSLNSLRDFFTNIPDTSNIAYLVILHLPTDYDSKLSQVIGSFTKLPVIKLNQDQRVLPGRVYILPGQFKVVIKKESFLLSRRTKDEGVNKVIDNFFLSLASEQKDKAIGIVFSGAGCNGAEGVRAIHNNGGFIFVEDPDSAEFNSMPLAAIKANNPTGVFSPAKIAKAMINFSNHYMSNEVK
jgi:chemotaxis response regulator CheB